MVYRILLKLCILFSFISPCIMTGGRKYDMETESMKLYGEDFESVLRRFRKTPDYLKILTDKMNELQVYIKEMSLQLLHYYNMKMPQRVNEMLGLPNVPDAASTTPDSLYFHAYGRRQEDPETPVEEEQDQKGVKILEGYPVFSQSLTVAERNSFRDLGYEFSGNLIHSVIENMGPVESPPQSTKLPGGGQDFETTGTTTEHPHTHEVTTGSTFGEAEHMESTAGKSGKKALRHDKSATEALRFRHNKQETTTEAFNFRYNDTDEDI